MNQYEGPGRVPEDIRPGASIWDWSALLVALVALGGSLWLSIGMNLKACPLCLYQRTFVMGVMGILGVGLVAAPRLGLAVVLGVLLAAGAIASAPPMPAAPTAAYDTPLEMCLPPFNE